MQQLTGKADIYINGAWAATSQEGASLAGMAGVENTLVLNSRGQTGGFTSKAVPSTIKANFLHGGDFDISALKGSGLSVVFACDNGKTYQIADATFLKAEDLDANKGMVAISYGGDLTDLASAAATLTISF